MILEGVDESILGPPTNVYRVSLHPDGLASRIENFAEYADHLLSRLQHQVSVSADPDLVELLEEIRGYVAGATRSCTSPRRRFCCPCGCAWATGVRSLMSTVTVFGTPVDITLAELAIETFFPADAATAALFT